MVKISKIIGAQGLEGRQDKRLGKQPTLWGEGCLTDGQDFSSRLPGSEQSLFILSGDVGVLPVGLLCPGLAADEDEGARGLGMCIVG